MRRDWRDTVQVATDLAVLGFLLTLGVLPLLTAGAALATGSTAIHHYLENDRWPRARDSWATFRGGLIPGLGAGLVAAAAVLLLVIDVLAVRAGSVPGGMPLLAVTAALAVMAVGYAGLLLVRVGADPGCSWRAATRSGPMGRALPAAAGIVVLTVVLAVLVHPVLVPVLAGYALYALHVVDRRLSPRSGLGHGAPVLVSEARPRDASAYAESPQH